LYNIQDSSLVKINGASSHALSLHPFSDQKQAIDLSEFQTQASLIF
jgi:hypothetical protein